jgi:hypothetical protein
MNIGDVYMYVNPAMPVVTYLLLRKEVNPFLPHHTIWTCLRTYDLKVEIFSISSEIFFEKYCTLLEGSNGTG